MGFKKLVNEARRRVRFHVQVLDPLFGYVLPKGCMKIDVQSKPAAFRFVPQQISRCGQISGNLLGPRVLQDLSRCSSILLAYLTAHVSEN